MSIFSRFRNKNAVWNPALEHIRSLPQNSVTTKLITALPSLADALHHEAKKQAETLRSSDALLAECLLDLELVGGFDRIVGFTNDNDLASIYVDAIIFCATNKNPGGIPDEMEFKATGTEQYHGIAKYSLAAKYFKVGDPIAWLFGKEYSKIVTGSPNDLAYVAPVWPLTLTARQKGAWITEYALTGRAPSKEERESFSALLDQSIKNLDQLVNSLQKLD